MIFNKHIYNNDILSDYFEVFLIFRVFMFTIEVVSTVVEVE